MSLTESGKRYMGGFSGKIGRKKYYNHVIISKIFQTEFYLGHIFQPGQDVCHEGIRCVLPFEVKIMKVGASQKYTLMSLRASPDCLLRSKSA